MKAPVVFLCLILLSTSATADAAPKTALEWLTLAEKKAESIPGAEDRAYAWLRISAVYAWKGESKQAKKCLEKVATFLNNKGQAEDPMKFLRVIAQVQAELKDANACRNTLQQAEAAISRIPEHRLIREWGETAALYLQIGDTEAAARVVSKVPDSSDVARGLHFSAMLLADRHRWTQAMRTVQFAESRLTEDDWLPFAELKARALAGLGRWSSAQEAANGVKSGSDKVRALAGIATLARQAGKKELSDKLIAKAVTLVEGIQSEPDRDSARQALMEAYLAAGLWSKAGELADQVAEGERKALCWCAVGVAQVLAGNIKPAKTSLRKAEESCRPFLAAISSPTDPNGTRAKRRLFAFPVLVGLVTATGDFDRAVEMCKGMESDVSCQIHLGASAAVSGQGPALVKWAGRMGPDVAFGLYLSAASGLIHTAEVKVRAGAQAKPATQPSS